MTTKTKTKKEIHWKCKKCRDEIYPAPFPQSKRFTKRCGIYVRLIGNEADREMIKKEREK